MAATASDAELLEASRRGEHAAFGTLVERYQNVVSAVSYSRTRDQALSEDVAQETFLAAWRQLDQLREPGRLRFWLCGIARNLARKARRRSDRETLIEAPVIAARDNPFEDVCEAQAERVVGEALARVPETYRDVLVLYYREQRSIRDVARALEISEAAALQRLARGRQYLADGVTSLVEKSLARPARRDLAAGVLAALAFVVPSRVEASPTHGGNMFIKIAIVTAALGAAGTTAYVVRDHGNRPAAPTATVAAAPTEVTGAPDVVRPRFVPTTPAPSATPAADPGIPEGAIRAPAPDTERSIAPETIAKLHLEQGASRGPADAPVTIVVFTDMRCKHCGAALGSLDQLLDEYPKQLRIVVKQMPVHDSAKLAAEAAFAADAQGKFWELHDVMLANQDDLSRDGILALATQAGLDVPKLRTALDTHAYADNVAADVKAAKELDIMGTPSFVINGRRVIGNVPLPQLRAAIDSALAD